MTELEKLYLNYLDMVTPMFGEGGLYPSGRPMTFEEYQKARKFAQGVMAETDASEILEAELKRIEMGDVGED